MTTPTTSLTVLTLALSLTVGALAQEIRFTRSPEVRHEGDNIRIEFTVSRRRGRRSRWAGL